MNFFKKLLLIIRPLARIFVNSLADHIAENGGKVLIQAAMTAVAAAESSGGSSSDKFQKAKDIIINSLKEKGVPVVISAINGAIEAAHADFVRKK